MAGGNDNMDWLYERGDGRNVPDAQQHTRALSDAEEEALAKRAPSGGTQQSAGENRTRMSFGQSPDSPAEPPAKSTRRKTFSENDLDDARPRGSARGSQPRGAAGASAAGAAGRSSTRPSQTRPEPPGPPQGPPSGRPPGPPPGPGRPPRDRKRHPVRNAALVLVLAVVLIMGYLVGVPVKAWAGSEKVAAAPEGKRPGAQPGNLYLLVGSDSRKGLSKKQQKKLGTGSVEGQRTDTMMLLYVPRSGEPALISLPRDSFVDIPGNGKNKLNTAYAFGGPQLLVKTVEQDTGLRVDGYMEVGFGGFVNVIDAVDGIKMCPKTAIKDKDSHLDLKKGCQKMDGVTALGYVRMRKADPLGDLGRVKRQREMLSALAKKVATPASVVNPVRYWNLNHAVAESITTGEDTSTIDVGRMGLAMRKISAGDGLTLTVPISDANASTSAGSSVLWDEEKSQAIFSEIAEGDTSKLKRFVKKS